MKKTVAIELDLDVLCTVKQRSLLGFILVEALIKGNTKHTDFLQSNGVQIIAPEEK